MMNKLLSTMFTCLFACVSTYAMAAPADAAGTSNPPPAHQQKTQVPDSTGNGNYLESQPNNNADTGQSNQNAGNPQAKGAKEKSKRFQQKPEDGGTGTGGSGNH